LTSSIAFTIQLETPRVFAVALMVEEMVKSPTNLFLPLPPRRTPLQPEPEAVVAEVFPADLLLLVAVGAEGNDAAAAAAAAAAAFVGCLVKN